MTNEPDSGPVDPLVEHLLPQLGEQTTIERELGGGGMSRVFLAHDRGLDRRIVVKVLHGAAGGGVSVDRFRREMLLSASLQHPHIVPILTAGDVDGVPWYSMPYIAGRSLRERLVAEEPLPVRDALRILRDVARAVSHAHEAGIVHRDLKPENVLLTGDAAVLIDLGIAKALMAANSTESGEGHGLTRVGFTVGTPTYMAPEQAAADPSLDHRADIYSFGVMAFELLAGKPPFSGVSSQELLKAHLADPVPRLPKLRTGLPPGLETLVRQCLAKSPSERPSKASELVDRLEQMLSGGTGELPALTGKNRWVAAAAAVALVAVVGSLAVWLGRPEPVSARPSASIAVLPFVPRGEDSLSTWMAAGLGDDVAAQLLAQGGIQVAPRLSVADVSRRPQSLADAASSLGVRTMLDGVVRRIGDELRVITQLVDAESGEVLWTGTYREHPDQAGTMVDDIVASIRATLLDAAPDSSILPDRASRDPSAYADFLRGRALVASRRDTAIIAGIDALQRAVSRDSGFASAHAALAEALMLLPLYRQVPVEEVIGPATVALNRALQIDPTLPAALLSRAGLHRLNWDWVAAEADLRLAVDQGPSHEAEKSLGEVFLVTGRHESARQAFVRARSLAPAEPIPTVLAGISEALVGRTEDARNSFAAAIALDTANGAVHFLAGAGWLMLGDQVPALESLARALELAPGQPLLQGVYAQALSLNGDLEGARRIRDQLGANRFSAGAAGGLAHAHLAVGDTSAALGALERALAERDPIFNAEPLGSPLFSGLIGSSRFDSVRRQAGLIGDTR